MWEFFHPFYILMLEMVLDAHPPIFFLLGNPLKLYLIHIIISFLRSTNLVFFIQTLNGVTC